MSGEFWRARNCFLRALSLSEVHSQVLQDVALRLNEAFDAFFRRVTAGETAGYPRFLRTEEQALARAQRKHQVALDAHKAVRAALTQRVKQAHPDREARHVWQVVSQDTDERAAWRERRVVARTHERIRWRRGDVAHQQLLPTNRASAVSTSLTSSRSEEHTSELQSLRHLVC